MNIVKFMKQLHVFLNTVYIKVIINIFIFLVIDSTTLYYYFTT